MIRNALLGLLLAMTVIFLTLAWLGFSPGQMAELFSHPVTGGNGVTGQVVTPGTFASDEAPKISRTGLTGPDYAVIAIYLVGMLVIGYAASRGVKTRVLIDDFGSFELPSDYWTGFTAASGPGI